MNQSDLARRFRVLHVSGDPVVLYNSHGPGPFVNLMKTLTGQARAALSS